MEASADPVSGESQLPGPQTAVFTSKYHHLGDQVSVYEFEEGDTNIQSMTETIAVVLVRGDNGLEQSGSRRENMKLLDSEYIVKGLRTNRIS